MRKTHKKVCGLAGLLAVGAVTVTAIMLPESEAEATTSVTDTIVVRVVGSEPNVDITNIESGETTVFPEETFSVLYENIDNLEVSMTRVDASGTTTPYILDVQSVDYNPGQKDYLIHFYGE